MYKKSIYKGINSLNYIPFEHKFKSISLKDDEDKILEKDPNFIPFYKSLSEMKPYNLTTFIHPIVCLHNSSIYTEKHKMISDIIQKNFPNIFVTVTINSDKIHIYSKTFTSKPLIINSKEHKTNKIILKDCTISNVLTILFENKCSHIVVIAGKLCSRGISFVTNNYTGHLTHMYLQPSKSKKASSLLQALRICGNYNDDIQLSVYTDKKTIETIKTTYIFISDKLEQLKGTELTSIEFMKNNKSSKQKYASLYKDGKKNNVLSKFSYTLNLIDGEDDGVSISTFNKYVDKEKIKTKYEYDNEMYLVKVESLNEKNKELYGRVVEYINKNNKQGIWCERSVIIEYLCDEFKYNKFSVSNNLSTIHHKKTVKTNDNMNGLLFKQNNGKNSKIYIKYSI